MTSMKVRAWGRLAVLLWGTLLPMLLSVLWHALAAALPEPGRSDGTWMLWDYVMLGLVMSHWTLVLTVAIGCWIVRIMKGPAYVADAYPLPDAASADRPARSSGAG